MAAAVVDTKALEALVEPAKLAEKGFPKPKRVTVSFADDHTGQSAYYVYLIFPNTVPDEALRWKKIQPMVTWVRDTIWKADGEQHFPYVRAVREKQVRGELA